MERIAAGCFLLIMLLFLCAGARSETAWVQTGKGTLNMRSRAETAAAVIKRIPNGDAVTLLEAGGEWSCVAYKGKKGYVKTSFLCVAQPMTIRRIYDSDGMLSPWSCMSGMEEIPACACFSAQSLELGDVLDIAVRCPPDAICALSMWIDGQRLFDKRILAYDQASYRPRACGLYRMEIRIVLPDGRAVGFEGSFEVKPGAYTEDTAAFSLYSQKDGWWIDKQYGRSNLDRSGCAIFTLSHALSLLGLQSEESSPQALAQSYPMYLAESGTVTESLLAAAGRAFGFRADRGKIKSSREIVRRFEEGAVFSFSVADGHIALAAGLSEDQTKVCVLDSSPSATFERIGDAAIYVRDRQGMFSRVKSPWEIPGARYYFETDSFGGVKYYLDMDYVARRGVRMILP